MLMNKYAVVILACILSVACRPLNFNPETPKGARYWHLDKVIMDTDPPICLWFTGKDTYEYRGDTCFVHKAAGFTAIYLKKTFSILDKKPTQ
jgi:hypothetical protein